MKRDLSDRERELVQLAYDHFGSAIRDNSTQDKIAMGIAYDLGDCDCELCTEGDEIRVLHES